MSPDAKPTRPVDIVVVTGMSGSGPSTAIAALERVAFGLCDELVYTSGASRRYLRERGMTPTVHFPNGVDTAAFAPKPGRVSAAPRAPVIFFNATAYSYQNVAAVESFLELGHPIETVLESLIGGGDGAPQLGHLCHVRGGLGGRCPCE